ncbi:short-chain fatty acyl-CoA regulator family protein [Pararhodospirillum oryzae]|uniref:XRE family transcriptional regulator n=1 Tax=Pararhodospirillum oryzae TaxID=478448 RepID=A0A512H4U1_9PROT|nr:short-chain fatty acyl-CoA regulator family protein [Pararhodospirillum oryzae]GEO80485.1 XRE family transcriptional regulator [Pararhodospirillum oryzae]
MGVKSPAFLGERLRHLREDRGLSQAALARRLGISASYLNQIERDQRPLSAAVALRINAVLGVDLRVVSHEEEGRLIADLREALADAGVGPEITTADLQDLASTRPALGQALLALHRRARAATERAEVLSAWGDGRGEGTVPLPLAGGAPLLMPYDEVRDFFYDRHNHIAELDDAAERLYLDGRLVLEARSVGLERLLRDDHGVRVRPLDAAEVAPGLLRRFDPASRVLGLAPGLNEGQRQFQMAAQLAFLEHAGLLARLIEAPLLGSAPARALARIGLAAYFAGAVVLPYGAFLEAAERLRYDIELLGEAFGVGFETVCHRLSTLQRPGAPGVPFIFVRVDRAGNISKRQSATDFHFSRVGGTCPLWTVYEAFAQPGRVLTQIARMPDGRAYLWIARTVTHRQGGFRAPGKTFAIGLGCDLHQAGRLVYARGLDLGDPEVATPIGAGCKVCERADCPQRAFPPAGRTVLVDENRRRFEPYAAL